MFLNNAEFSNVIERTPLVSIDLIVMNQNNEVLLGKRLNRPAQGFWFVPGGRIVKDEPLGVAFKRLTLTELGVSFEIAEATFIGLFEHFYSDNVFNDKFSTHYVVIAYKLKVQDTLSNLPTNEQHANYSWMPTKKLLECNEVHKHTKQYFE